MVDSRNGTSTGSSPSRPGPRPLAAFRRGRPLSTLIRVTLAFVGFVAFLHVAVLMATAIQPPPGFVPRTSAPTPPCVSAICREGPSWVDTRSPVITARFAGSPEDLGRAHASLLHAQMIEDEGALWSAFRRHVPSVFARTLVLDIARLRFRRLDERYPHTRRLELAAAADSLMPDPFALEIPTYQRLLYLNSLYDVALSFEGSPLVGCTSVAFAADPASKSPTLLARNFDFETDDVFDRGKAVLVFQQDQLIPVLSVGWPGLMGVVSGMNAAGVGIVIHGARAGHPTRLGEPVPITVREALSVCRTTRQAVDFISKRPAMVSHMLLIADAQGTLAVMERVPERPAFVRWGIRSMVLTNHLEGPSSGSAANQRVRANTSTLARRARADQLVAALSEPVTPADLAAILRDRGAVGGAPLAPGDRRAIDAGIATHGVIMDLSALRIWVSEGPHLDGRFLGFSLPALLRDPDDARQDALAHALPARAR